MLEFFYCQEFWHDKTFPECVESALQSIDALMWFNTRIPLYNAPVLKKVKG